MNILQRLFLIVCLVEFSSAYKILGLIPFSGRSHYISMQPIFRELAERGHEITVLTTFKEENPPPNYREIIADKKMFWEYLGESPDMFALEKMTIIEMINLAWGAMYFTNEAVFNSTSVREFIKNDNTKFDVVVVEAFYQESLYMFSHKYKTPMIAISTNGYNLFSGNFMGNPNIPAYMTHEFLKFKKDLSFLERLSNTYAYYYDIFWRKYFMFPRHQKLAEEIFGPGNYPDLMELEKNISLLLINTHYSYDSVRALVPGIVEIGGVHIPKPKPLPNDIQNFLDDAKDGVIYFSFGSNMKIEEMSSEQINVFVKTFNTLKQKVIWKCGQDNFAELSKNVMIKTWVPQNDILAHPNVKVFISHGGLLSTQEAMYHGVPILGFPFYGDQFLNLKNVQDLGYGSSLAFSTLTEEILSNTLNELLNNPTYFTRAKEISRRFHDRPMSAMDTAIYWIEYVIRNNGAPYMKSPITNLSVIEYYMLDLWLILITALHIFIYLIYKTFRCFTKSGKCRLNKIKTK